MAHLEERTLARAQHVLCRTQENGVLGPVGASSDMSEEVRAIAQAEKGLGEFKERATPLIQRHRKKRSPGLGFLWSLCGTGA